MKFLNRTNREENFELLRVIAMFMVIVLHTLGHGGIREQYEFGTLGYGIFELIRALCMVAVDCFVLISGYFMIFTQIKPSRIFKFIMQIEFYSLLCLILAKIVFNTQITMEDMIFAVFPLSSGRYWFATSYIILLLLIPFLNKLICEMTQIELKKIILVLLMLFFIIPNFLFWSKDTLGIGYDFVWFIVVYFVAAYIRLYEFQIEKRKSIILYVFLCVCGYLSKIGITQITSIIFGKAIGTDMFFTYNSLFFSRQQFFCFYYFETLF